MNPFDPFGRISRPPLDLARREDRIRAIGDVAAALLDGRLPDSQARLFVASALLGWLQGGGDLARHHLRTTGEAGSHTTPAVLWRRLQEDSSSEGQHEAEAGDTFAESNCEGSQ